MVTRIMTSIYTCTINSEAILHKNKTKTAQCIFHLSATKVEMVSQIMILSVMGLKTISCKYPGPGLLTKKISLGMNLSTYSGSSIIRPHPWIGPRKCGLILQVALK